MAKISIHLGRKDEPAVELEPSEQLIAVRTRSTRSLRSGPVAAGAAAEVRDAELVLAFPEAGVEVYRVPEGAARSVEERKAALRQRSDVRFAGSVLVDPQSGEPVLYTENLFVKFTDECDLETCHAVLRDRGLTIKSQPTYAANAFFVEAPEGIGRRIFDIAAELLERDDVEFCHPELIRRRGRRAFHPFQWHLKPTTIGSVFVQASANVEAAHAVTRGAGVTIAIIDDGVDIDHPEFQANGKIVAPRDATLQTDDPRPKDSFFYSDDHGTACAGVACAAGVVASGVAPAARLMPIRLVSGLGSQHEADALTWAVDKGADVISCSWGPEDGDWFDENDPRHDRVVPIGANTRLAIDYATRTGRGGKGCVVLFAAGNGAESVDNDGYASYEGVVAVAACNDRGKRSVYSDFGNAIWCCFPSSDFGDPPSRPEPLTPGIWTADRRGAHGYNPGKEQFGDIQGEYTNDFGGTSSACPGAAGIAALILSVNPDLNWREVREVMRRSCDQIDPGGGEYDADGHSKLYGYGRLNAHAAARLAKPAPRGQLLLVRRVDLPLPDLQTVQVTIEVTEAAPIESLAVLVRVRHDHIGDLRIQLFPPAAMDISPIELHTRTGGGTPLLDVRYDAASVADLANFDGANVQGIWTLEVTDESIRDEGVLEHFGLSLTLPTDTAGSAFAARLGGTRPGRAATRKSVNGSKGGGRKAGRSTKNGSSKARKKKRRR